MVATCGNITLVWLSVFALFFLLLSDTNYLTLTLTPLGPELSSREGNTPTNANPAKTLLLCTAGVLSFFLFTEQVQMIGQHATFISASVFVRMLFPPL